MYAGRLSPYCRSDAFPDEFEELSRQSGEDWKELLEMLSRT